MSDIAKVALQDGLTPFTRNWIANNPRMFRSLMKSAGWFVQKELKKASRGNVGSSASWKERWPLERRRIIDPEAPRLWYGKLRNALGYAYDKNEKAVNLGWTSKTSAMYGRMQEEGYRRVVTPFIRRFFGKRGIYFRRTTKFLEIPARPFIDEKMDEIRNDVSTFVNNRVEQYIENGGFMKKIGKGRKYTVYK
ncbi:MAG: hypothetical protein IJ516_05590 [Phascolarctobacterium sp.]|nr:hypothetical protein [Phascolarctobacterium sp.]